MTDRLLSVDDVAEFLGVKRDTVYKLIDRNGLPGFKVGRLWKFRQEELDRWVDKQASSRDKDRQRTPSKRGNRT